MNHAGDPFQQHPADPFATSTGPPTIGYPQPGGDPWQVGSAFPTPPVQQASYNTFAVLSPILAVPVPPAAVVLGHLALPQIRRTGERGRLAAILGLVIGYLMCAVLLAGAIWLASTGHSPSSRKAPTPTTTPPSLPTSSTSVVTSVAPPSILPRVKLPLGQATVGTCVEIQLRGGTSSDELDLFKVPCEHREGVYTVVARVTNEYDCNSTYVAASPDRRFFVCLNLY